MEDQTQVIGGHHKDLGFYSERNGKALRVLEERADVI